MTANASDRPRILLVEDEELNRTLVRAVLARAAVTAVRQAEVIDAHTLAQARQRLAEDELDVVLLDMNLPDGNGLTLAREIADAAAPRASRPTIIAVTASVLPQDRQAAIAAGCDGFLDKPYAAAELVAVIAEQLDRRSAAQSEPPD